MMSITARTVLKSDTRLEVRVLEGGEERVLFFASDRPLWPEAPPSDDYIAVALGLYCAHAKRDLFIDGAVTQSILRNVDEHIKIWSVWRPDLYAPITIRAAKVVPDAPGREGPAALAFSGGVDACYALAGHKSGLFGAAGRDIGLGVLMIGFDIQEYETEKYRLARESAKNILEHFGAELTVVSTNFREDFCMTRPAYAGGIASVLHTLAGGYASGVIASANDYLQDIRVARNGWNFDAIHLYESYTFPIDIPGGTDTRLQRVGVIAQHPAIINNLRICWVALDKGTNCGVCSKCVRTRLELIIYGKEPDIFNAPMEKEHIEQLTFESSLSFIFMEEIASAFPKDHPLYETVKMVYEREKEKLEKTGDGLADELAGKSAEAAFLQSEIKTLKSTKSYKLAAPLRMLEKKK